MQELVEIYAGILHSLPVAAVLETIGYYLQQRV
jgi:hypothetical protein